MVKNRFYYHVGVFLLLVSQLLAQSDYRITQEFKSRHRSFEIAIEYAKTADELEKIKKEIAEFKNDFRGNKELLNRALYPNNFESSFKTLDKKIEYTNKKLTEISTLKTKVQNVEADFAKVSDELKILTSEVSILRKSNHQLMAELQAFKSGYRGSKGSIDSLRNLVAELKKGISKRDTLIKEIMDNVFMTAEHKVSMMDDSQRKQIKTRIQGTSLIDNIRTLINDNIGFLNASTFTHEDLNELNKELTDFEERWNHFGPKLFDIYSDDQSNKDKLTEIDTLIANWEFALGNSIWKSIHNIFTSHNISINEFSDSLEFKNAVLSYIDKQISGINDPVELQKDKDYIFFSDKVWKENIKSDWLPLLLSSNQISQNTIMEIENKLDQWNDSSTGSKSYFVLGIIILLALIIIVSIILVRKKNKTSSKVIDVSLKEDVKNYEIGEDENFVDDNKE